MYIYIYIERERGRYLYMYIYIYIYIYNIYIYIFICICICIYICEPVIRQNASHERCMAHASTSRKDWDLQNITGRCTPTFLLEEAHRTKRTTRRNMYIYIYIYIYSYI